MNNNTWQLQEAKNKFSQLVEKAMHHSPQVVTKHGEQAVVVLSIEDYKKMTASDGDLLSFFEHSPLKGINLDISRSKKLPRQTEL